MDDLTPTLDPPDGFWRLRNLVEFEIVPSELRRAGDAAAVLGIGWFARHYYGFLLRDDLYLYGDHPGQFYRLWQLLAVVWPEQGQLIGWSPYWHAGWAELAFYPPGFALAGWLLWWVSFQQLSPILAYQVLVFGTVLLPGLGFYALLAWGFKDRLAGIIAAWLVMTLPYPLGGAQGTIIGLIGDRLAFGLTPLFMLAGLWSFRADPKRLPWLITGVGLAALLLMHPYQILLPIAVLGLYILPQPDRWPGLRRLGLAILLALGLTAFWWLPLTVRYNTFIPLIEAPLVEIQSNLRQMWLWLWGWLLPAMLIGSLFRAKAQRRLRLALLLGGVGMFGFIFFSHYVLVEAWHIFTFDPVRLITGVTFALVVGVALGLSELAWLIPRWLRRWRLEPAGWPCLLIVPWLAYTQVNGTYNFEKWIRHWQPAPNRTPIFLSEAEARYNFSAVWEVMATTPGRILFTSHYGLLFDVPTTLKAAVPILTGREIIGGTFSHRTPVQSYLWTGRADPPVLRGKIEHQDDKALAGISWEKMTGETLLDLVHHYNITLIATTAADRQAQSFLNNSPHFRPVWSNQLFTLYHPADYQPAWVEAKQAAIQQVNYSPTALDIQVDNPTPPAELLVKISYHPLWQADIDGEAWPIYMNEHGLMQIPLPARNCQVHLRYRPGWPERTGALITWLTLAVGGGGVIYRRYLRHVV